MAVQNLHLNVNQRQHLVYRQMAVVIEDLEAQDSDSDNIFSATSTIQRPAPECSLPLHLSVPCCLLAMDQGTAKGVVARSPKSWTVCRGH